MPVPDLKEGSADAGEQVHHASALSVDVAMPECSGTSGTSVVWIRLCRADGDEKDGVNDRHADGEQLDVK